METQAIKKPFKFSIEFGVGFEIYNICLISKPIHIKMIDNILSIIFENVIERDIELDKFVRNRFILSSFIENNKVTKLEVKYDNISKVTIDDDSIIFVSSHTRPSIAGIVNEHPDTTLPTNLPTTRNRQPHHVPPPITQRPRRQIISSFTTTNSSSTNTNDAVSSNLLRTARDLMPDLLYEVSRIIPEIPNMTRNSPGLDIIFRELSAPPASTNNSVEENTLTQIGPIIDYLNNNKVTTTRPQTEDCAICREKIDSGQLLNILPCSHYYHNRCIKESVISGNLLCPMCRTSIISNETY